MNVLAISHTKNMYQQSPRSKTYCLSITIMDGILNLVITLLSRKSTTFDVEFLVGINSTDFVN